VEKISKFAANVAVKPQLLLWLALVLALAGSLKHLAHIFASVDGDALMGWLQAVAIDAGLFALAYSIRIRKASRRSIKPLWFGVVLFSGISIYGNLAYGLVSLNGALPQWIVSSRPYVLAGSLPILVLFLAELLSDDRQHEQKEAAKIAKKVKDSPNDTALEAANEARRLTIESRRSQVFRMADNGMSQSQIASELGVSLATVKRDTKVLNGRLK